jgi:hypothetical protein
MSNVAAEEAQSLVLRQQGNEAFKAGQHQQALAFYWQAVSHNPEDYALFNNISLAALKMGDVSQVWVQGKSVMTCMLLISCACSLLDGIHGGATCSLCACPFLWGTHIVSAQGMQAA